MITTTGFNPWETETFKIISTDTQNITLNGTLQYDHIGIIFSAILHNEKIDVD